MAKELAVFTSVNIVAEEGSRSSEKVSPSCTTAIEALFSGTFLHYLMIANHDSNILMGNTATEIFLIRGSSRQRISKGLRV